MTLTLEDLVGLPELNFEATREIKTPIQVGRIAPVRMDRELIQFDYSEILVFGYYRDNKSGKNYLVYSNSLRPSGGFPECTSLDNIHMYEKLKNYS